MGRASFGFPQHYAAASLKPAVHDRLHIVGRVFSAALRCGLIEANRGRNPSRPICGFSAALRCGLIEASQCRATGSGNTRSFPQHYAAASLKLGSRWSFYAPPCSFSAALRCGLIEATPLGRVKNDDCLHWFNDCVHHARWSVVCRLASGAVPIVTRKTVRTEILEGPLRRAFSGSTQANSQ